MRRKFRQRVQIVISLFALLIGITLTTLAYAPKANACDPRCYSVVCGSGSCDVQGIYCSNSCSGGLECLQRGRILLRKQQAMFVRHLHISGVL